MNVSLLIAKRYLFSKKKYNAINIITTISLLGVSVVTAALIIILSVFNGFQDLASEAFTSFDPQLKIVAKQGKFFNPNTKSLLQLKEHKDIELCCNTLEEKALAEYDGKQTIVTIKGVEEDFRKLTNIEKIIFGNREFKLKDSIANYAIMGVDLVNTLGTGVRFTKPLSIYTLKKGKRINTANPKSAFRKGYLYSSGNIFIVNQEKYDSSYILAPIKFAQSLFNKEDKVSSIEIKAKEGANIEDLKARLIKELGNDYYVQDRLEQQADIFKMMKVEKYISYIFLTFILLIASFNIISSLSMVIIDKKGDMNILRALGATSSLIRRIYLYQGMLTSTLGSIIGIIIGVTLCLLQMKFGLISMGEGNYIVESYPMNIHYMDIITVAITIIVVSFIAIFFPLRYLLKR